MKFGKKTMLMVVLIFLGIILFMYFRNSRREGLTGRAPTLDARGKRDLTDCKKAGGTWKDKTGKGDWKCE